MNNQTSPIRRAREAAGLTQIQLARRLRITQGALSSMETGKNPRLETLRKIAKALKVPVASLVE